MWLALVYALCALLLLAVESKEVVNVRGKVKMIVESVETRSDHDFVEYFNKVPNQEVLHTFRVVRLAPTFSLSIIMRAIKSQRIMYKINVLDGCQFLNNPLMNKVLASTYRTMVVNNSFFKCPIQPKVYFLKNIANANIIPSIHPAGHYELNVRVKMSQSPAPFVMEVVWKYIVVHLK